LGARSYIFALCALLVVGFGAGALLLAPAGEVHVAAVTPAPPVDPPAPPEPVSGVLPPDAPEIEGYSGTLEARQPEAATHSRAKALPQRAGRDSSADELQKQARALASAADYSASLRALWELSGRIEKEYHPGAGVSTGYDILVTRFEREPIHLRDILFKAFEESTGVARQTLIFHIALALPEATAFPWLRKLAQSSDAADATDATCALAFRGDAEAMAAFEAMPAARVNCRRIVDTAVQHDAMAAAGEREFLRSYRCIEAMDCRPYFLRHPWAFKRGAREEYFGWYRVVSFPWADRLRDAERNTVERRAARLLPAWIAHFRGHPGTDDMCYRLACHARAEGEYVAAAEWASLGATEPDQDMKAPCTALLLALAELYLSPRELDAVTAGRAWDRNRELLLYIRMRREVVDHGFEAGLRMARDLAAREPESILAVAYAVRWSTSPARGLKSGLTAMDADDPLMIKLEEPDIRWESLANPAASFGSGYRRRNDRRTQPEHEAVQLPTWPLASQLRHWETQADLLRRRDAAVGEKYDDLTYKVGAVFYHGWYTLYPVYADHLRNSGLPDPRSGSGSSSCTDGQRQKVREFREGASNWALAARWFEQLADRDRHSVLRDKALFSAAKARVKLVDDWPWAPTAPLTAYIPEAVRLFERVVQEHPESTLADDAANAARYWRRNFRDAFTPSGIVSRD
jgi:hypothetical protein